MFDLISLISFGIGLVFGMTLFTLLYTLFFIRGIRLKTPLTRHEPMPVKALDDALKDATESMLIAQKEDGFFDGFVDSSKALTERIATYYYPESKYPMLELSVEELLQLDDYIHARIASTLNKGVFRNVKHVRVVKFIELIDYKKKLDQQKWMQVIKSKNVQRGVQTTLGVVNAFNPVYWFRKFVIKTSMHALNKQIAKTMLAVVAEETNRVYSKSVFNESIDYDLVDRALAKLNEEVDHEDASYTE